ncbi:MAG: nitrite reductase [Desulfocapsa sp.]|nr:MAG: nitrite reductase [Desulfocapsa sp.]
MSEHTSGISITVLLPAGRLPLEIMGKAHELAQRYKFGIYFSLAQNMRMINVPQSAVDTVKEELAALGASFKGPNRFPLPRICIGKPHCNLGVADTEKLNRKILARFGDMQNVKARFKISIAGCTMGCPWTQSTDISVMATRSGYNVYTGGKGGLIPRVGRRIKVKATEDEVLDTIAVLIAFHDKKTKTKRRIFQLLNDPEFPFPEV